MINVRIGDKGEDNLETVQNRIKKLDYYLGKLQSKINKKQEVLKTHLTKTTDKDKKLFDSGLKRLQDRFEQPQNYPAEESGD